MFKYTLKAIHSCFLGQFGVAMNEGHFKDLLFELIPPPAQRTTSRAAGAGASNPAADLMMMGFPTRLPETSPPALPYAAHGGSPAGEYIVSIR